MARQEAKLQVDRNAEEKLSEDKRQHYEAEAHNYWNKFYEIHENRFFKDRNWLFTELPDLANLKDGSKALLEIGCGSGSTVYPLLQAITNDEFRLYCCDFSTKAVDLVKSHPDFDSKRCCPFVCNVTNPDDWAKSPLSPDSLDFVLMVFTLSAMEPETMKVQIVV